MAGCSQQTNNVCRHVPRAFYPRKCVCVCIYIYIERERERERVRDRDRESRLTSLPALVVKEGEVALESNMYRES